VEPERYPTSTICLPLTAALGWWQADPAAGYVLVCYAAREVHGAFCGGQSG
jgi:hypothetical protein